MHAVTLRVIEGCHRLGCMNVAWIHRHATEAAPRLALPDPCSSDSPRRVAAPRPPRSPAWRGPLRAGPGRRGRTTPLRASTYSRQTAVTVLMIRTQRTRSSQYHCSPLASPDPTPRHRPLRADGPPGLFCSTLGPPRVESIPDSRGPGCLYRAAGRVVDSCNIADRPGSPEEAGECGHVPGVRTTRAPITKEFWNQLSPASLSANGRPE